MKIIIDTNELTKEEAINKIQNAYLENEVCNCYREQEHKCFHNYTKVEIIGYCDGTKNREICYCNGDKRKCTYYKNN